MIGDALKAVGAARSIVIDERNEVLAGNGVVEAASAAGMSKVQVVDVDGDTIVAVRRRNLSPEQKRQLAMYDNRTGELAEWNVGQLKADMMNAADLQPFFFDKELDALMGQKTPTGTAAAVIGGLEFRIVVDCEDEAQQADLLARLEAEGLTCRALIS